MPEKTKELYEYYDTNEAAITKRFEKMSLEDLQMLAAVSHHIYIASDDNEQVQTNTTVTTA